MGLSRRTLILSASAALVAGAGGLALWPGRRLSPPAALRALDARTWSVLASVAQAMCPGGDGLPSADELDIASALDLTLSTLHDADQAELKQGLLLLDNALPGLLLDGRPSPFSRADVKARAATLLGWRTSRIGLRRQVYKALRGLVMAAYWGHPRVYASAGYPGPPDFGQRSAPPDDLLALAEVPL